MTDMQELKHGLIFRRMDLHVHTPASTDFIGDVSPEDIVREALDKDLSAIAITDHNTGKWIDEVKAAASSTELTVYPGVELTCAGGERNIHVLAIFDPSVDGKHISGLLSALGVPPAQQGREDALINEPIQEIVDMVQDTWGGVAILAHANSSSGVLNDMKGEQRTRIIQHPTLLAVEASAFQHEDKAKNGKRVVDLLDGSDPVYRRALAVIQGSDNPAPGNGGGHALSGIGSRSSFFNIENHSLNGLVQCFSDPDVRILQDFEYEEFPYPRIKQVSINSGFLAGQTIKFHDGLNSILGGKGAGKSVLVELMRFGLNQPPSNPDLRRDHDAKLESQLGMYGEVNIEFEDETAHEIALRRTFDPSQDQPFADTEFDPAQVLSVLFLSQNEIIRIAESEDLQLQFIDQFFDFRTFHRAIESVEEGLAELDKLMADGMRAFSLVRTFKPQIGSIEEEIKKLERQLKHPVFEAYSAARRKKKAFDDQLAHMAALISSISGSRKNLSTLTIPPLHKSLSSDPALRRANKALHAATKLFESQLNHLETEMTKNYQSIQQESEKWEPNYQKTLSDYQQHVTESGGDYQALAKTREIKFQELDSLNSKLAASQALEATIQPTSKTRDERLDKLASIYEEYTSARKDKCQQFEIDSGGRLKLTILESSNAEVFQEQLITLKQGSYLREEEIDAICSSSTPRDFIFALLRYAISEGDKKYLKDVSDKSEILIDRMVKLADFLIDGIDFERLLALQYRAIPQDRPEIRYLVAPEDYRLLSKVSVGQKSIALLLMALSEGVRPIVIDQPEDSLDIRSIWEDICTKIRAGKRRRQFIFTTHNSSVAVASDTDRFLILEATADQASLVFSGSLDQDPVGEQVLQYLEGGLDTYERKYLKYDIKRRQRERLTRS